MTPPYRKVPNRRNDDRRGGEGRSGEKPWMGWTEESTPEIWTARCRYCSFSLSIARSMFPSGDFVRTRAMILRTRAGMIDHLAAKHLDKAMR